MSKKISISQKTTLQPDKIKQAINAVFTDLVEKYTLKGKWQTPVVFLISGEGINGALVLGDGSVDVELTICGVLSAFTPIIESHVRQKLRAHLSINPN